MVHVAEFHDPGDTKSELVVVNLDPIAIRILQIDLMDAVGAVGNFAVAGKITVFHLHLI